jgi:hypothetical protein
MATALKSDSAFESEIHPKTSVADGCESLEESSRATCISQPNEL